ncbi:MAG TPA: molybdenum cofactor guanylyltransferase [Bryobacteraceae bacterium]|nr:molybdenum cofactor guanylyltransferase [Bryobacteraceae bacterium]
MSRRAGYVLVGGNSSRMGRNKALLSSHGRTLSQVVGDAVRAVAGSVAMVGGSPETTAVRVGFVPDLYPGEGPLGGILSALRDSAAEWNLIAACDMPALKIDFLSQLMERAEHSQSMAVIPAGPSGRLEPLCAAYHRNAAAGLQAAFDRGIRKIAAALAEIPANTWQVPEELSCFQNVNTPEDWAAYDR